MERRHLWFGLQALGTVVLLAVLFRDFDWDAFAAVLRRISPAFYAASLAALVAGQLLYAMRWRVVLAGMGVAVSYGEVLRQYFIGLFFSNVMPTAVGGDAAKVYYLGRRAGYVEIGASVFLDRFLGFFWLSVLGAVLAWAVPAASPVMVLNRNLLTIFAAVFVVAVATARFFPIPALLPRLVPARWGAWTIRVGDFVGLVRDGACRPVTLLTAGAVVIGYSWLITLMYQQHFAANGLAATATLPVMLALVSMSIFVNVPISVNGIGLREQLHVLLFTALGVPKEVSVSLSLLFFAHSILLSLVGCALWLKLKPAAVAA